MKIQIKIPGKEYKTSIINSLLTNFYANYESIKPIRADYQFMLIVRIVNVDVLIITYAAPQIPYR